MSEKGARQLERDITRGYKVGDLVCMTHLKRTLEKGFMPRWQREVFKVVGSKYMKERLVYKLQDLKGEDVDGWFCPEMLRPHIGAYNRAQVIEKVNKRNRQGVNVKYLGWPEKFNETIPLDKYNRLVQTASNQKLGDILRRPRVTMEQQEAKYLPENNDVTFWYFYNPVCCLRSHCQLWQDSTRLNQFICTTHGVDHICGMTEEQWGPLPHQKYVGWRCPIRVSVKRLRPLDVI